MTDECSCGMPVAEGEHRCFLCRRMRAWKATAKLYRTGNERLMSMLRCVTPEHYQKWVDAFGSDDPEEGYANMRAALTRISEWRIDDELTPRETVREMSELAMDALQGTGEFAKESK